MLRNLIVLPDGTKLYSGTGTQNAIQSVTVTESVNSGTELTLGSVCCSCLEATIINPGGGLMLNAGDVVQLYKFETDKDLQSLDRCEKVGTFLLEKPVRPTANTLKITAYDFISLLDKDLSDWLLRLDGWPYAVTDFAKMVCGVCGLQANEDTVDALPNGDYQIQKFAVSVTGRKLMEWVGQIGGRFCRADKDGYMEFAWYEPTNISIGSGDSYYMGGSLSYEGYTVSPIEKVQIRLTEDDVGVVAPDGDTTEKNTYIITGNYLLSDSSTAAIQTIAQSLYTQLRVVTYTPLKVTVPLDTGIRAGQIIQVIDRNGKKLPTYVMTAVQTGQRIELESTGSCRRDSTTVVNNESLRDLRGRVLTIQKSAEMLRTENKDLTGRCSTLEQQVGSIKMEVTDGKPGNTATIKLTVGDKVYSGKIDMTGLVTFTNLKTKGQTVINGSNITTGEILADLIKAGQIHSAALDGTAGGVGIDLDAGLMMASKWNDDDESGDHAHVGWDNLRHERYDSDGALGQSRVMAGRFDAVQFDAEGVLRSNAILTTQQDGYTCLELTDAVTGTSVVVEAAGGVARVYGLTAPVSDSDAANKAYVDGRLNRNYLDNWYFPNAVNQRGAAVYRSEGFTVDRWKLCLWPSSTTGAYAYPNKSDLTLHSETAQGTACSCYLEQVVDEPARLAGKTVTFSAKLRGVTVAGDPILRIYTDKGVYKSGYIRAIDANSIVTLTATLPTGITSLAVGIGNYSSYGGDGSFNIAIESMKLELGGVSTLAYDQPPDKTAQLLECQRYFVRFSNTGQTQFLSGACNGTACYGTLLLPMPLRGTATPTVTGSGVNLYPFISGGNVAVNSVSGYAGGSRNWVIVQANYTATDTLPAQTPANIRIAAGGYIDVSAEI